MKSDTLKTLLANLPQSWVDLTTHRLDIYDESQAKSQFLTELNNLVARGELSKASLLQLPTAYDYIRLGHQLSSVLEWALASINDVKAEQVISFTSKTMPILALLRDNAIAKKHTHIYYLNTTMPLIDEQRLNKIYGFSYQLHAINGVDEIATHDDDTVLLVTQSDFATALFTTAQGESLPVDAAINIHPDYGSVMFVYGQYPEPMVKAVQHVRRRESIAMSPRNCLNLLRQISQQDTQALPCCDETQLRVVEQCIKDNTGSVYTPLIASSGLSIQYAILMGAVEWAKTRYPDKPIEIILPPNCYGGTNDQARRIANLIAGVTIVDLPVDGGKNLVDSLDGILNDAAAHRSVPIVLAEIPTNPRVEVPDMQRLAEVLSAPRASADSEQAVAPVFMIDQTFCPNVTLLADDGTLAQTGLVSFSSGSKFPSGGRCIAGFCAVNRVANPLLTLIAKHLDLCDNRADDNQLITLAENMPSMRERIAKAYAHARTMVEHIQSVLPQVKINFVSDDLAKLGFTPSVFSFDLPSKGDTPQAREVYQKLLNKRLIDFMIECHPDMCKYCVSYGQLKGCYWTIPATSTQGTTKETDKDYVVRVALAPEVDVTALNQSFSEFCRSENLL